MLFQTLRITRRLQDELEQIQKRGRVSGLLAHWIEKRPCPSVARWELRPISDRTPDFPSRS
jgi:hypothetical protein